MQTSLYSASKHTLAGRFGEEICALGAPCQSPTFFGIAQCKHPHTRYPKTPLWTDLAQRYTRLEHHAETPHFLALRSANTPILGIQKPFCWQIWCRGMRASSATPKPHIFLVLCISNTLILGSQKCSGGQIWCRGTHAWSATPIPHIF